jgi:hypothetical protein
MIVLAREVFLCKCATDTVGEPNGEMSSERDGDRTDDLRFVSGGEAELDRLDPRSHNGKHIDDFRARLARGEHWLVGLGNEQIVTYTWLHTRPRCEYPYLPGCAFALPAVFGYGYDAWTIPELRSRGLRRRAFVEELRMLAGRGKVWEASFFVAHQIEGARRSLAQARVAIVPLWRVRLGRDRIPRAEVLAEEETEGVRPCF